MAKGTQLVSRGTSFPSTIMQVEKEQNVVQRGQFGRRTASWLEAQVIHSSVTLGRSLNLSETQFPHQYLKGLRKNVYI